MRIQSVAESGYGSRLLLNPDAIRIQAKVLMKMLFKSLQYIFLLLIKTVLNVFEIPCKGRQDKLLSSPAPELFSYKCFSLFSFWGPILACLDPDSKYCI
jgi:hypothetical protein